MDKKRKNLTIKALVAACVMGLAFTSPMATTTVHAELVDETDEWNKEGEQHNEDITEQEQQNHDNNSNEQDANAHVDNSNGGSDETRKPDPVPSGNSDPRQGEVTDWENWNPWDDPTWDPINPVLPDGLEDEVDRKSDDDIPKTPDTNPYAAYGAIIAALTAIGYKVVSSKKGFITIKKDVKKLTKDK